MSDAAAHVREHRCGWKTLIKVKKRDNLLSYTQRGKNNCKSSGFFIVIRSKSRLESNTETNDFLHLGLGLNRRCKLFFFLRDAGKGKQRVQLNEYGSTSEKF